MCVMVLLVLVFYSTQINYFLVKGMDGSSVLQSISTGYRMPRPQGQGFDCPQKMYEVMLQCWDFSPEKRPTFAYLLGFFDDYATETEEHYHPSEAD